MTKKVVGVFVRFSSPASLLKLTLETLLEDRPLCFVGQFSASYSLDQGLQEFAAILRRPAYQPTARRSS